MSLDNPERIPNPKGWYNHDHTEMFHGIMPVQGGAHRPRLQEWHPFSAQVANDDDVCANKLTSSSRNLTYITRLHPCATAIVQAYSRQRRRSYSRRSIFTSPSLTRGAWMFTIRPPRPRLEFRSNQYSYAPRSLWNTSHCKPKSGTMGRQRLYPST